MGRMPFGVASKTGRLRNVLLCEPEHYDWAPINVVARATLVAGRRPDPSTVRAQWVEFVTALGKAQVARHFVAPNPALTYRS